MTTALDRAPVDRTGSASVLRITEIFLSIQGEARTVGLPTVFVRLTGCPLRCQYCDTTYAFWGGRPMAVADIVGAVCGYGVDHVTVTGGEPLAQRGVHSLMSALCDAGHEVSLETSGALDVSGVDSRVSRVVDIKTPGSGEVHRNRFENLALLDASDQIKFVICDETDYAWAKLKIDEHGLLDSDIELIFSPSADELSATDLADWIVRDRLGVRLQIQLHKILWGDEPGR